ncbi:MAG: endo-1,4-beta-xylanase, partial [Fidelibacterota bacterium]
MKGASHTSGAGLKDVLRDDFHIGAALSLEQIYGKEPAAIALVEKHFNSITPENILKWEAVHPEPDRYDFEAADRFVTFGEQHNMFIVGHTLVWFAQTPDWVFRDESGTILDREALLRRMKGHIDTVMGRYRGRIHGWDVVNEAIMADGTFRNSKWFEIIGEDHVHMAFEYARQADPEAQLYYNDYNMWKPPQYEGVIRLVHDLHSKGIHIDGVGIQGHWGLDYPELDEIETLIQALATLGIKLMITELDVGVI